MAPMGCACPDLALDEPVSKRAQLDGTGPDLQPTLRVKQLLGLESSMANPDLAAPTAAILPNRRFHAFSRAAWPSCNQCGNRPVWLVLGVAQLASLVALGTNPA